MQIKSTTNIVHTWAKWVTLVKICCFAHGFTIHNNCAALRDGGKTMHCLLLMESEELMKLHWSSILLSKIKITADKFTVNYCKLGCRWTYRFFNGTAELCLRYNRRSPSLCCYGGVSYSTQLLFYRPLHPFDGHSFPC